MAEVANGRPEPEMQQLADLGHVNRNDVSRYLGGLMEQVPWAFDAATSDEVAALLGGSEKWEGYLRVLRHNLGIGKQFSVGRELLYLRLTGSEVPTPETVAQAMGVDERTVYTVRKRLEGLEILPPGAFVLPRGRRPKKG
jgi:hypothetical protein